jgi:class 3 adenylate cyclase
MRTRSAPPPAARKRSLAEQAADPLLDAPRTVIDRLRGLVVDDSDDGFLVTSGDVGLEAVPKGVEPPQPGHEVGAPQAVERAFAFLDITGFTAYCDRHGERAATEVLTRFRALVRDVVGSRGVRVAKWLGDGVMLVGTQPGPLAAATVELTHRFRASGLDVHAGLAAGSVLLFEGDDYIGRTVNLAARLCEAAEAGEVLAGPAVRPLPRWIERRGLVSIQAAGIGRVDGVARLAATPDIEAGLFAGEPAA